MTGGARPPAPPLPLPLVEDVESAFYLHLDVADRPGVLASVTQVLGEHDVSIKSVVQRGMGEHARLVMVTHPVLESSLRVAVERIGEFDFVRSRPAHHPCDRRGVRVNRARASSRIPPVEGAARPRAAHVPLIERYRERLPFEPGDPLVTLQEGSTPLLRAPVLSEMVGATVRLKLEGANPTGSFKDRGMTCAVSAAVRDGAKAVICASTGNTAASAAAYAARAGITCAVIVPEGKIAQGKMAQTLVHGARVISLQGNFDQALTLVRELTDSHPIVLVNSVNEYRIEGQKTAAFEIHEGLEGGCEALCIPVGNAGNITSYWRGFREMGAAPQTVRLPGRGGGAAGARARSSSIPKPSPARSGSATPCAGRTRWRPRPTRAARSASVSDSGDPRRLPAAGLQRRDVLRARLGGLGGGAAASTAPTARSRSSACSPAVA